MALTLADFKKITNEKEEEAKRVREEERKVDKAERAAERAQHIEAISKIIETSVKDEVRRSVKPVQERNEAKFSAVEEDINQIKNVLKTFNALRIINVSTPTASVRELNTNNPNITFPPLEHNEPLQEIIASAKLTIGLEPFNESDLNRVSREHQAVDRAHILKLAALEFLRDELKVSSI